MNGVSMPPEAFSRLCALMKVLLRFAQIDDQIALLINAWCELLVFSCCFRSLSAPEGVIR